MVKWLRGILVVLVSIIALLVVVGFFLPSEYRVERSIEIAADPEWIHTWVGDLQRWPEWTPWQEVDPTIKTVYGEKTEGVGARQSWSGQSGDGELIFTRWDAGTGVQYEMSFDAGKYRSIGSIRYHPFATGTRVTWDMSGHFGPNIVGRWFGLMMNAMVGQDFEHGLEKLKVAVESAPAPEEYPADDGTAAKDAA